MVGTIFTVTKLPDLQKYKVLSSFEIFIVCFFFFVLFCFVFVFCFCFFLFDVLMLLLTLIHLPHFEDFQC